jgi:branched-chain amino acid transport system ATP-binding protein
MSLLAATDLQSGYGPIRVLFGVDLEIAEGQVLALVGRNGMGKTTTIRAITGELTVHDGTVQFLGQKINGVPDYKIARMGIGIVPEGRQVFPTLSVEEHLVVSTRRSVHANHWTISRVLELFPRLRERSHSMAKNLSGGEQQMLAIARALLGNPTLLILDEATEGLAPLVRNDIWNQIEKIAKTGMSVLVVDKDLKALSRIADRFVVLSKGRSVWGGTTAEFMQATDVHQQHLGV